MHFLQTPVSTNSSPLHEVIQLVVFVLKTLPALKHDETH